MLRELLSAVHESDTMPGKMDDYVHYTLVGDHGDSDAGGRVPVDLKEIRALGVEPIVLPLEQSQGKHDPDLVTAALLSLC